MRIWCLSLVFWSAQACAITQISVSADSIVSDLFQLSKPNAVLNLQSKQQVKIHAEQLQLGDARLDNPNISLDISHRPTLLITSDQLHMQPYQVRHPRIFLDYRKKTPQPTLSLDAEVKTLNDEAWGKFHLDCMVPEQAATETWRCEDGLYHDTRSNIPFDLLVTPTWKAVDKGGQMAKGVDLQLSFDQAKFSDAEGLHAADNLTGKVNLSAHQQAGGWRWQGVFDWQQGELFWQPFYFADGNKRFEIKGYYRQPYLDIEQATLSLPGVGLLHSQSRVNLDSKAFELLKVDAHDVDFNGVYQAFIQPLIPNSAFGHLNVSGKADWSFEAKGLQPLKFHLKIADASLEDELGKFGFSHLNANIPWDFDQPKQISMGYQSGHILKIPLGQTKWQAEVNRYSITSPSLKLPILDGALEFQDISAAWINQSMVWHVKMDMQPISMSQFSQALDWPTMRGQITGAVPLITYANHELRMTGDMQFKLFNGMVGMSDLDIDDPLGAVPKLHANFTMRDIDLGEITRTFNFGSITGKLEGDIKHLRLQNWKPVYMDAVIQTADGPFEKKISQRAVENITALGGEGTAAALQRTFLRFFKEFGYEKIGLRCELRGDICKMGGVEAIPGGFVIVKGKGAPSVHVNGYTEYVSWKDVLGRMQRVTDSNSKIIID
ncbi:MAG TPA: hypothetical protein VK958_07505 [Methylophilus sp.]|uniref:hypothetical protein n=1 Tax=Methylophilus sp. TaxID=29541 RepID=UPI002CB38CD8|nr:hypothetical protein [Methylophilus sp.]HSH87078.1 hypothetical protein [Methylophilus sp.]